MKKEAFVFFTREGQQETERIEHIIDIAKTLAARNFLEEAESDRGPHCVNKNCRAEGKQAYGTYSAENSGRENCICCREGSVNCPGGL